MVSKMNNKFDRLKAIAAGQAQATSFNPTITFWKYELNNPLIGTIKGFDGFHHANFGSQETVIVELESGEVVSAILNPYLSEGMRMRNAQVDDLIYLDFLGKENGKYGKSFNKYNLIIDKPDY
jgi:hypothetical protein